MLEPDVRGQLQLLQCEVAFRRALAGLVDDLVAEGLGLDPRCQPLRAAALVAAQREGRWEGWRNWPASCCHRLGRAPATAS